MRRVDACASFLWILVTGIYLAETYLLSESPSWFNTAKIGTTSLCCLVGFASAVATRKITSQRRQRPRRSEQEQWTLGPRKNITLPTVSYSLYICPLFLLFPVNHCPPVISVLSIRISQPLLVLFLWFNVMLFLGTSWSPLVAALISYVINRRPYR